MVVLLIIAAAGLIGFAVGRVVGRAQGFQDCWRQYVQPKFDKWDKMEKEL